MGFLKSVFCRDAGMHIVAGCLSEVKEEINFARAVYTASVCCLRTGYSVWPQAKLHSIKSA